MESYFSLFIVLSLGFSSDSPVSCFSCLRFAVVRWLMMADM